MAELKKSPEVRFDGFTEDWETTILGSIVDLENGFAFKGEYFQEVESEYIVLTPGNVNIGGGFQYGKGNSYNPEGEFPEKFILKVNDIFLTMTDLTPTAQTLGFPAIVPDDGKIYLHNQRLGKLVNFSCDVNFLFQLLCRASYQNQVVRSSSGTTVKHTSPERILKTIISFPKEKEQKRLSVFFNNIDKLLENHQIQLTKLKNLKKAMLVKMFPQEDATVPEIRFKGFEGEWEKFYLSDLFDFSKGKGLSKKDVSKSGNFKCLLYGHLYTEYEMIAEDVIFYTDIKLENEIRSVKGDILVPSSDTTPTGLARATCLELADVIIGGDVNILRPKASVVGSFLSYNINANRSKLLPLIKGTTVRHLYNDDLKTVRIFVPENLQEQKSISAYFKNIDNLVVKYQEQLKKLDNIKKACLSKMFVA